MIEATRIPLLSVVVPVYNAARFLRDALESILEQDFSDFECIAIDDGSIDASAEILDEYAQRDTRLRVLHQPNAGIVKTLNRGICLAQAPFIARMDADDICLPGRFKTQLHYFLGRDDLGVLGGQIQLIDDQGRLLRLVDYPAHGQELESFLRKGSPLAHPAVMFRKVTIEKAGFYRQAFRHAEDYDLWLRVHEAGYAIENLKIPLIAYRQHPEKVSMVYRREQAIATLAAQCAHRARMAKLPDPTAGIDDLDEKIFDLFQQELIADLGDELLAVHMSSSSFDTEQQLVEALTKFRSLPANLQRSRGGASFLMHASLGALKRGLYALALRTVIRTFTIAPAEAGSIVARRASRVFGGLIAEHSGESPGSRKVPVE